MARYPYKTAHPVVNTTRPYELNICTETSATFLQYALHRTTINFVTCSLYMDD